MPILSPYTLNIIPAKYGENIAAKVATVFIVAIPVPRFSGLKESAIIADVGGN
jgi:hypothetical protein